MQTEWMNHSEEVLTSLSGKSVARLIPSSEGPKLLINREEYSLKETCWDVEMFHGRKSSMLIFYWKGEVKLSVKCAPLSNLLDLHSQDTAESEKKTADRGFNWSQVEAFLVRLYQCLNFKSRSVSLG
ncbi:hypothetical protein [Paenibacillus eucommiae]|uniref:Uncharacterized protein n=1 Tax=Paenibacillus eucommiae TaxID=1355755 RepID=A0ABS4INZ5_9BACL|nr:hypothetical protein [Paenibacillus eucommiae]MBP1989292.1 hypothetical protein [Paenibacillus eucommiae]